MNERAHSSQIDHQATAAVPAGLPAIRPDVYTVAEIARTLGRTRQAVYTALAGIPAPLQKLVRGQKQSADAWPFKDLPERIRVQLDAMAPRQGCRNGERLLAAGFAAWDPPQPWEKVPQVYQERARKLRDAFAELLPLQHSIPAGELQERGLLEYRRVFGHTIQSRTWRRLFDRTVERDRGREDWQRLDLYVDEEAYRCNMKPDREALKLRRLHQPLDEIVRNMDNRDAPTPDDKDWLLREVYRHFEEVIAGQCESERRAIKASLLDYLHGEVPSLSRNAGSLRYFFNYWYRYWIEHGRTRAYNDRRHEASGNFRRPDFSADDQEIGKLALKLNKNVSLAHRRLRKDGKLSPEYCTYNHYNPRRNKSYVSRATRQAVAGDLEIALPYYRGPKEARLAAPHSEGDWSNVSPGQFFTADDVSWNHYWWDTLPDGQPYISRGECLVFTDDLTDTPLAFSLHGREELDPAAPPLRRVSYNATHIRLGMLKVHDDHGLPDEGWVFEGGTWQARLVRGDKVTGALHLHWRDTQANCGGAIYRPQDAQQIRHARIARAKTIERVFRTIQEEMRTDPAFVGFDERRESMERMQEIIRRVRAGSVHPRNVGIPHRDDFVKIIRQRLQEFMHEEQNGKRNPGISPWAHWQQRIDRKPLRKLTDEARWVFASHFKRLTIRDGRITIRGLTYSNEATVEWNRREVLAFFNLEEPRVLFFSDLNRTQFFAVKAPILPARNASAEQLAAVRRDLGAYNRKAREIYHSVMHPTKSNITRDDDHSETTKEIGRLVNATVAATQQETSETERMLSRIRRNCELLGREMPVTIRHPASFLAGQDEELRLRKTEEAEHA